MKPEHIFDIVAEVAAEFCEELGLELPAIRPDACAKASYRRAKPTKADFLADFTACAQRMRRRRDERQGPVLSQRELLQFTRNWSPNGRYELHWRIKRKVGIELLSVGVWPISAYFREPSKLRKTVDYDEPTLQKSATTSAF